MDSIQIVTFLKSTALSNGWNLSSDDVLSPEAYGDIKKNGSCHCGVFLEGDELC